MALTVPRAMAPATASKLSSGKVKIAVIGCSCVSTTIPLVSVECTMLPGSTRRMPVRPLMGEVIRV